MPVMRLSETCQIGTTGLDEERANTLTWLTESEPPRHVTAEAAQWRCSGQGFYQAEN